MTNILFELTNILFTYFNFDYPLMNLNCFVRFDTLILLKFYKNTGIKI